MPIDIPTSRQEVDSRMKTDVQAELKSFDPFLPNSALSALISGFAGRIFETGTQQNIILQQMFPDTSEGSFLERWGSYRSVVRNSATQSLGSITATGLNGALVPINTILTTVGGVQYQTIANSTISNQALSVSSLSRSGFTATVITTSNHSLASGVTVTISGANESEYNITASIIVVDAQTFTYTVAGNPNTPATGTIIVSLAYASIDIKSIDFGSDTNLIGGTPLTFSTALAGVDNQAYVQTDGLTGGSDQESDKNFRKRVLFAYQQPNTPFNVAEIIRVAKTVTGVTRVFVEDVTNESLGTVTVYFTRDNDPNIIPSAADVNNVKDELLEIKPAHTQDDDLNVLAPTPKSIDFVFANLSPNTATMQTAIKNNLDEAFKEQTVVGEDVPEELYRCTIFQTIDPETGDKVQSFFLSSPVGGITIDDNEIAVFDPNTNIIFP